jgi:L-lactate permease
MGRAIIKTRVRWKVLCMIVSKIPKKAVYKETTESITAKMVTTTETYLFIFSCIGNTLPDLKKATVSLVVSSI